MKHPLDRSVPFNLAQEQSDLAAVYAVLEARMRQVILAALPRLPNATVYVKAAGQWHNMHMRLEDRQVPIGDTTLYDYPQSSALLINGTMVQFANWLRAYKRSEDRQEELVTEVVNRQMLHFVQYVYKNGVVITDNLFKLLMDALDQDSALGGPHYFTFEGIQTTIIEVYIIDALLFGKGGE